MLTYALYVVILQRLEPKVYWIMRTPFIDQFLYLYIYIFFLTEARAHTGKKYIQYSPGVLAIGLFFWVFFEFRVCYHLRYFFFSMCEQLQMWPKKNYNFALFASVSEAT